MKTLLKVVINMLEILSSDSALWSVLLAPDPAAFYALRTLGPLPCSSVIVSALMIDEFAKKLAPEPAP